MTTVLSASIGGYDTPKSHVEQTEPCKFITLTDDDFPGDTRHPRVIAKEPKLRPWRYGDGPWIWIDGSAEITSATFVNDVLAAVDGPLGQFVHPHRDCIYPEAEVSATMLKYEKVPVLEQANHYRSIGHPADWGLWATGVIVYREPLEALAGRWWTEIDRWGYQDQISQPVALKACGLRPDPLPYELWGNPWIRWYGHRSDL